MIQIGSLGLKACSGCTLRFDCKLKPNRHTNTHDNEKAWLTWIASSPRHSIKTFDDPTHHMPDMKCIFDIKGTHREHGWGDSLNDVVILDGGFVNDLLEYCRYAYPGFEQGKEE